MSRLESPWTQNQSRALDFPGNICVLAGAGSGKTKTLVELMIRLVEGRVPGMESIDITRILALTYTEKAAREMRDRVRKALNEKISGGTSSREVQFWTDQRRLLDRAQISTIHGFCLWVLRQYCLDAGLDADFSILDEDPDFLRTARRETLLDLVQQENPDLLDLLAYYPLSGGGGYQNLDRLLTQIIGHYRTFGRFVRSDGPPPIPLRPHIEALNQAARMAGDMIESGAIPEDKGYFATIADFIETWRQIDGNPLEDYVLERLPDLESLVGPNWYKAKNANQLARQAIAALRGERDRRRAQPIREKLTALSKILETRIEADKNRRQLLDFDDLLLLTRGLLAQSLPIRKKLKERYGVVLVDEFQDTNRLQADIIALLMEAEGSERVLDDPGASLESLVIAPRRLVILGDPKQSIYRFRGAEVEVFEDIRQRFMSGQNVPGENAAAGQTVALDRNFRSQPRLVGFFNRFFEYVAGQCAPVSFTFGPDDRQSAHRPDLAQGSAVVLLDTEPGGNVDTDRELEAAAVARYIQGLLDRFIPVSVGDEGRPPQPGDITILLRRFTHLKAYEAALRRQGIPFYTVRGKGFYQCQEVWDLINFIFYLSDPQDGAALLGVLRSPLVGLSDEIITRLAWPTGDGAPIPLRDYFGAEPAAPPAGLVGEPDLQAAQDLLKRLTCEAGFAFPAELLEIVIEQTQYLPVLLAQPQGAQKAANVQRLIEIVRALPPRALFAPRELARFFRARIDDPQEDPEAQTGMEGERAVQIMTIHQAKGLEFPIVFVPDIEQKLRTDSQPIAFGPKDELAVRFRDLDTLEDCRPADYLEFQEAAKAKDDAEALRLLYVAATRAQDHLVFSGCLSSVKDSYKSRSWATYLNGFANDHADILPISDAANPDASPPGSDPVAAVAAYPELEDEASLAREAEAAAILKKILYRAAHRPATVQIDVTGLAQYLTCPRRYYLERIVGLPGLYEQSDAPESSAGLRPVDLGNIYHYMMESLDFHDIQNDIDLHNIAIRGARIQGIDLAAREAKEISKKVLGFLSHDWGRDLIATGQAGGLILRETPIWIRHPPAMAGDPALILSGTIDMYYVSPDGEARLVDYKYARPKDAGRYTPQVKAYALGLIRAGATRKIRAGLYFAGGQEGTLVEIPLDDGWMEAFQGALTAAARGLADLETAEEAPGLAACPDPTCVCRPECEQAC